MTQLLEKNYAQKYVALGKTIVGIAVNFDKKKRIIEGWQVQILKEADKGPLSIFDFGLEIFDFGLEIFDFGSLQQTSKIRHPTSEDPSVFLISDWRFWISVASNRHPKSDIRHRKTPQ